MFNEANQHTKRQFLTLARALSVLSFRSSYRLNRKFMHKCQGFSEVPVSYFKYNLLIKPNEL